MGLFGNLDNAVFVKNDNDLEYQLKELRRLKEMASGKALDAINAQIKLTEYGMIGEKNIRFELENSHIPMYVIHDLYLEHDGLSAQIDYLLVTNKHRYVIECKNLYGDIEIDADGSFYRMLGRRKEGFYSPVTQNERHLELIRKIRLDNQPALLKRLSKMMTNDVYKALVVLANPRTVLKDKCAPQDIRDKVIRADQMIRHIKEIDKKSSYTYSESEMSEYVEFLMRAHVIKRDDGLDKFRKMIEEQKISSEEAAPGTDTSHPAPQAVICPKCGATMVLRTAKRGSRAGNRFWGCSRYPKCKGIVNINDG